MFKIISKEALKEVLDYGGSVTIPYKSKMDDEEMYQSISIHAMWGGYVIDGLTGDIHEHFQEFDDAYKFFSEYNLNVGAIQSYVTDKEEGFEYSDIYEDWVRLKERVIEIYNELKESEK